MPFEDRQGPGRRSAAVQLARSSAGLGNDHAPGGRVLDVGDEDVPGKDERFLQFLFGIGSLESEELVDHAVRRPGLGELHPVFPFLNHIFFRLLLDPGIPSRLGQTCGQVLLGTPEREVRPFGMAEMDFLLDLVEVQRVGGRPLQPGAIVAPSFARRLEPHHLLRRPFIPHQAVFVRRPVDASGV